MGFGCQAFGGSSAERYLLVHRGWNLQEILGCFLATALEEGEGEEKRREGGAWACQLPLEPREQAVPPASLATKIQAWGGGQLTERQREPLGGSLTISLMSHLLAFSIGEAVPRSRDEGIGGNSLMGGVVHGKERRNERELGIN